MISKDNFLKNFSKDEMESALKVYDSMYLAYSKDITVFTKSFLSPSIWSFLKNAIKDSNITIDTNGGYEICDRRIVAFNNNYGMEFPFKFIKITNKSKFNKLGHRDYLGALMALGIEREKMGDLRVVDNYAIVPIVEELAVYVAASLTTVGKAPVYAEEVTAEEVPSSKFEELTINVSSERLDNFIAKLSNISRSKALDIIDSGKALVNYSKVRDKSLEINEGDIVTISGVGKFIIGQVTGSTKSGKVKVSVKRYI